MQACQENWTQFYDVFVGQHDNSMIDCMMKPLYRKTREEAAEYSCLTHQEQNLRR